MGNLTLFLADHPAMIGYKLRCIPNGAHGWLMMSRDKATNTPSFKRK